jgi:replicative DNA helicase
MRNIAPPSDIEAERAVVSACLLSVDALAVARDILRPDQMFDPVNRIVLSAAYDIDTAGSRIDAVTLVTKLRTAGQLEAIGGSQQLMSLFDATPDPTHIAEHSNIVVDKHRLRRVIDVCKLHMAAAYGDVGEVAAYCDRVERDIMSATDPGTRADAPQTIGELIRQELPAITERQNPNSTVKAVTGTTTGIYELNQKLRGGLDNMLYVIAGRPGQGKTALALCILAAVAHTKKAAVFFGLEMPKEQLALRLLSMLSLVEYNKIKADRLERHEWNAVLAAAEYLAKLPISLQYRPGVHISQIRSTFRREFARLKREFGAEPGVGAIDYAQLVSGDRPKGASRDEEIGSISRACMALPAEFQCPLLLLSQLNREVEKRPNKRPQISDLRESGSLEQDAYGIFLLYRDEYYNETNDDNRNKAEINVGKNRNGDTGIVDCKYDGPCIRFASINEDIHRDADDIAAAIGAETHGYQ